ncbi:MAG TPA: hypothetical protein VEG38_22730 [Acidimicrobiia bacterium]|nr:hypothetical protein [Acidimicrobiia bacterium]
MPPSRKSPTPTGPGRKESNQKKADELVAFKASRQWGAFTGAQARDAGLSHRQIDYRVRMKRWRREARDVFVLTGTQETWQQRAMTACLAGPAGTVLSHLTALAVYRLGKPPAEPHVIIPPKANGGRIRGASVRRAALAPGETAVKDRLTCTTPVRTVLDCSELLGYEELCDVVDSALCRKLMQPSRLIRAAEAAWLSARGARREGLGRLREALDVWRSGASPGSPPEVRLQRRLKEWGFPPPQRQVEIRDKSGRLVAKADLGITEWKVFVEYDSDEHHGPRYWIADGERLDRVEAETGWRMVAVDRFDLRPSTNNLRDRLEKLRPAEPGQLAA